jgi:hypothetical protein
MGHLPVVLQGLARLRRLRMFVKWWLQISNDLDARNLFGTRLSGAEGWESLEPVRMRLESWISEVASRRSPLEWSDILRWFGHEYVRHYPEQVMHIASVHANTSRSPDRWLRFRTQAWLSGPSVLTDLDDLISLSVLLSNVGTVQRRIGKGQVLILGDQFKLDRIESDERIEKAITLYDLRQRFSIGNDAGASTGSMGSHIADTNSKDIVIAWMDIRNHRLLSSTEEDEFLRKYDPVFPIGIDLQTLAPSRVFPESITKETGALVAVLQAAWRWLELRGANFRTKRGIWTQRGYLDCSRNWFIRELERHRSPIPGADIALDPQEIFDILRPSALSVIYPVGSRVVVDLLAASHSLGTTISRSEDGQNANVWASDFEVAVQRLIDGSRWRPPDALRPLIGRVIRSGRNAITDIDAVAVADKTLLLIDAKAYRLTSRVARGEYSATRTLRERIEADSQKWLNVITRLRQSPELLGVPVPGDFRIDGIVVLPFIPYVSIGPATEPVLSLLRASSVSELLVAVGR